MSIPARVNVVTIGARDVAALAQFYDALGWPRGQSSADDFVIYGMAGAVLALYPRDTLAEDGHVEAGPISDYRGVTFGVNVERKDQVDEAIATAQGAGAVVTKAPEDAFWGGRSAYFADPEGNLWEVAWAPMFKFDERGSLIVD
jgi:catechol 2,3-dioxygenase-like lactoylglutathione lyase family enzyme